MRYEGVCVTKGMRYERVDCTSIRLELPAKKWKQDAVIMVQNNLARLASSVGREKNVVHFRRYIALKQNPNGSQEVEEKTWKFGARSWSRVTII